jgi:hypothetical protein
MKPVQKRPSFEEVGTPRSLGPLGTPDDVAVLCLLLLSQGALSRRGHGLRHGRSAREVDLRGVTPSPYSVAVRAVVQAAGGMAGRSTVIDGKP